MPVRTIRSLVLSSYYGLFVALSTIPTLFIAYVVQRFFGIVPLGIPPLGLLFLMVVLGGIFGSYARTAGSVTGLQSLTQQPRFRDSLLASMSSTFLIFVFLGSALAGLYFVNPAIAGGVDFETLNTKKAVKAVMLYLYAPAEAKRTVSLAGMQREEFFFLVLGGSMVFSTFTAMLVVPRAVGLEDEFRRAYSFGLIMTRLLLALPFCGFLTLLMANMLLSVIDSVVIVFMPNYQISTLVYFTTNFLLFTGMIYTFESHVLGIGYALGEREARRRRALDREDTSEIRALREAWDRRG